MSEPECQGCRERDATIAALLARLAALESRVLDLEARLGANAGNSSMPPSANPPGAPAPVVKAKTGRKPGGQMGHPPHSHRLAPPERVDDYVLHVPGQCERCRADLDPGGEWAEPGPVRHQVAELPAARATVTEHRAHALACRRCGHVTRAAIPPEVRANIAGPNLSAVLGYLGGAHRVSRRGLREVAARVFGVSLALGTIDALQMEASEALAPAHAEALDAVRPAPVKNVDETGWKQAGQRRWLWVAATATVAAFVIHARRGAAGLAALLGDAIAGVLCTDRWSAYGGHPPGRRQVCWAHLKRDFQKVVDRGGAGAGVGRAGLEAVEGLFGAWHLFRGGGCDREGLRERLGPVREALGRALREGAGGADPKAARFCRNLQALGESMWLFAECEGVEPTNNHAERVLRRGVIWRKNSFGSHSEAGCRLVERMLTVVQTLGLQNREVLAYLSEAIAAHRTGRAAPRLLPQG